MKIRNVYVNSFLQSRAGSFDNLLDNRGDRKHTCAVRFEV
jgi:hypothetical protein